MPLLGNDLTVHDHLVRLVRFLELRLGVVARDVPAADDGSVRANTLAHPFVVAADAHEGQQQRAPGGQVSGEPPHRPASIVRVEHELERGRRHKDRAVAPRQVELLHRLQVERGGQTELGGLGPAEREHLRRHVHAVDVDPEAEVVEQEPAGAAANIEYRLALGADELEVEVPVGPVRRVAPEEIPGLGNQSAVFVVHREQCPILRYPWGV